MPSGRPPITSSATEDLMKYRKMDLILEIQNQRKRLKKLENSGKTNIGTHSKTTGKPTAGTTILKAFNQDLLYQLVGPFAIFDAEQNFEFCNEEYRTLFGYSIEDTQPGQPRMKLAELDRQLGVISRDQLDQWDIIEIYRHHWENPGGYFTFQLSDGRWLETTFIRLPGDGRINIVRDVTIQKNYENRIVYRERLILDALEQIQDGFILFDPNNQLIMCNEIYRQMFPQLRPYLKPGISFPEIVERHIQLTMANQTEAFRAGYKKQRLASFNQKSSDTFIEYTKQKRWIQAYDLQLENGCKVGIRTDITRLKNSEKHLRDQERFLREVIDDIPASINIRDATGKIVLINKELADIYQIKIDDVIGKRPEDFLPKKLRNTFEEDIFKDVLKSGKLVQNQEYIYKIHNKKQHFLMSRTPIHTSDGAISHVLTVGFEITKLRQTEQALRETEKITRQAIKIAQLGQWSWDHTIDQCIYCSKECANILGFRPEEYISRTANEELKNAHIHPDDLEDYIHSWAWAEEHLDQVEVQYRVVRHTGEIRHVSEIANIFRDESGCAVKSIGTLQDITESKKNAAALQQAMETAKTAQMLMRDAIENMSEGFSLYDQYNRLTLYNKAYLDHYGYDKKTVPYGISLAELQKLDRKNQLIEQTPEGAAIAKQRLETFGQSQNTIELPLADGRWMQIRDRPTSNGGTVSIHADITHNKQAEASMKQAKEEAERAAELKTKLVAMVSHEVRTPMNGVLGMARLLRNTSLLPEQKDYVETIVSSGEALLHIIDDLLDVSKLEADKLELETIPFRIADVARQSMAVLAGRAEERGLDYCLKLAPQLPEILLGDPYRLRQVLLNLLSNAIKFTSDGSVTLEVKTRKTHSDWITLQFLIEDTGQGITEQVQAKLFSQYTQGSVEVARKYGGTGLGLSICRHLVHLMKGTIQIESRPGQGTCMQFTARFQVGQAKSLEQIEKAARDIALDEKALWEKSKPLKILLVEDNLINRKVARRTLRTAAHKVTEAVNGRQALDLVKQNKFDAILMDRHMPEMNGITATKKIRKMGKIWHKIPIIGITAGAQEEELHSCMAAGMDVVLTKPVKPDELLKTIYRLVTANRNHISLAAPVLAVDDNPVNRKVMANSLQKLTIDYALAKDGAEALQRIRNGSYSILLTDLNMPEMDGIELARKIRHLGLSAIELPIIGMSASLTDEEQNNCKKAGMQACESKPVTLERLHQLIAQFTGNDIGKPDNRPRNIQTNRPPVNLALLSEILGSDDKNEMRKILHLFVECFPDTLAPLRQKIAEGNSKEIQKAAHKAKGGAQNTAATEISEYLETIEKQAREENLENAAQKLFAIEQAFERLRRFVAASENW